MKYLKKLLDELESVMDQVETELQRRIEETPGTQPQSLSLSNQFTLKSDTITENILHLITVLIT